jgi:outer membrane protein assembly factor BamB
MPRDNLYIGSNGYVAAIDARDGQELWRTQLGSGLFSSTGHEDVCVLEHDGRIFAGCHGHLFCLEGSTGDVLWHNELKGMGHNDVTLTIAGKSVQFVSSHSQTHTQTST